jgi:opacity protein-like surface antigen
MKASRRFAFAAALLACAVLAAPRPAAAFSVGFKLYGGYSSINGGDINEGLKGSIDLNKLLATLFSATVTGDYKAFHGGLDWGGDLILYFTPVVGLGFGAGMVTAESKTDLNYYSIFGSGKYRLEPKVKVIPLRAGLYFSVPMGAFVNLTLNGGAEYLLANVSYKFRDEYTVGWSQSDVDTNSRGKLGLFAGLGLEIRVHRNLSILLEGRGRYARVDGFSGSRRYISSSSSGYTENGDLWFFRVDLGSYGRYPIIDISDTPPPASPPYMEARSARLSLDGFVALAGIMIRI